MLAHVAFGAGAVDGLRHIGQCVSPLLEPRQAALRELYRMRRQLVHLRALVPEKRKDWDALLLVVRGISEELLRELGEQR